MDCIHCGNPIPEGRLQALPGTKTCTKCSTTGRVKGHAIITGKTTYSELEILSAEQAEEIYQMEPRKGNQHRDKRS
jgi:hypothetical protein